MTSTSCNDIARDLLARAIAGVIDGEAPAELPRELLEDACSQALFGILAEGLADRFEPALCEVYADLFAQAIPGADPARYRRVRVPRAVMVEPRAVMVEPRAVMVEPRTVTVEPRTVTVEPRTVTVEPRTVTVEPHTVTVEPHTVTVEPRTVTVEPRIVTVEPHTVTVEPRIVTVEPHTVTVEPRTVTVEPRTVFVLSRVTLGADVAVTSVLLDAAKQRFPRAQIVFVGPPKNYELFAADPRIAHAAIVYRRGTLQERLVVRHDLEAILAVPDALVIDSDSRLTQLGLVPVCPEDRYHLFESRGYGGSGDASLPQLAAAWAEETFGVTGAKPYIALAGEPAQRGAIAVSFGVGENPDKRLPDPFEENLLALLAESGAEICIDKGAGGEEAARVERAVERSGVRVTFWEGSFAGFAAIIAAARLYIGYDSAGQHVAAAAGVPLISVFAGFPAPRMFERWRPAGNVIRVDNADPAEVLARVRSLVKAG